MNIFYVAQLNAQNAKISKVDSHWDPRRIGGNFLVFQKRPRERERERERERRVCKENKQSQKTASTSKLAFERVWKDFITISSRWWYENFYRDFTYLNVFFCTKVCSTNIWWYLWTSKFHHAPVFCWLLLVWRYVALATNDHLFEDI